MCVSWFKQATFVKTFWVVCLPYFRSELNNDINTFRTYIYNWFIKGPTSEFLKTLNLGDFKLFCCDPESLGLFQTFFAQNMRNKKDNHVSLSGSIPIFFFFFLWNIKHFYRGHWTSILKYFLTTTKQKS